MTIQPSTAPTKPRTVDPGESASGRDWGRAKQTAEGWKEESVEAVELEGERAHAKIKDTAINKIYKITNNALGISLIVKQPYYVERRSDAGSLWLCVLELRERLEELKHQRDKTCGCFSKISKRRSHAQLQRGISAEYTRRQQPGQGFRVICCFSLLYFIQVSFKRHLFYASHQERVAPWVAACCCRLCSDIGPSVILPSATKESKWSLYALEGKVSPHSISITINTRSFILNAAFFFLFKDTLSYALFQGWI